MRRAALIVLVSLALGLVAASRGSPEARAAAPTPGPPPTLAVSYFDNNSGDAALDPLARGLADMLITDLGRLGGLRLVERGRLNEVLKELALARSPFIDPAAAVALGRGLSATAILTGGYAVAGDALRIDARVVDVATGEVLAAESVAGDKGDFFALEKDLVDVLVRTLGVDVALAERRALRRNATESYAAFEAYARGLAARDAGDDERARAAFAAALAADPGYAAARDALERLTAVLRVEDARRAGAYEAARAALDPKAPGFAAQVADALRATSGVEVDAVRRRVELLLWLQERGLEPALPPMSPVPGEALALAQRMTADPAMDDVVAGACAYFLATYPREDHGRVACHAILQTVELARAHLTSAQRKKAYDDEVARDLRDTRPDDWRRGLIVNGEAIRRLLRGYAARAPR